ncbi:MAG: OmpA family protein [Gammaproteobacteria bacterium]|nr:OmpA family protein [Gammaproteobacteria bacterium]NNL50300.1 OmpA family protein [Woeseiaceae bacterium]
MSVFFRQFGRLATILLLSAGVTVAVAQDDLRDTLFTQTDDALKAANEARANILAPKSYGEAADAYRSAEDKLQRGRSIESIRSDLDDAAKALRQAVDATRLANVTLTSAIQARDDAEAANAKAFATTQWREAEEKFASAAKRLEDGNVKSAKIRANDAEELFRSAELAAIKANYLDETRRLIGQAKDDRVDRYAPKTLAKAEALLGQAESALTQDRYDTDEPRSLARQAKYEVKHAMYLARELKPVRDRDVSLEDFALANEAPIVSIAGSLDLVAELDEGFDAPTNAIVGRVEDLQKESYELSERRSQIFDLEDELQRLEKELGIQSNRLAAQEAQRRKFRQIESTFNADEAQVLTQGQNILVRPIGLVFSSGSAQIETEYFSLLRKVQDAIRVFPDSHIVVEGHTDSFGGDATNLELSQARAEAVREYLLANMRDLSASDVESFGYGESRPVANNETVEGRAKNRRIDVVIRPKAGVRTASSN